MAEWLKAADCKSVLVRVRWFESISAHQELSSILKRILLFLFLILKMDSKRRIRKASCGRFSRRGSTNPSLPTNDVSVRTKKTDRYKNQSENKSG